MASKTKSRHRASPSYVVFEPYCEWQTKDGLQSLVFHLPDFKKDQLKVHVNNLGVLRVSGERPPKEDGTKGRRFIKETKLLPGCNMNDIRARFIGQHLQVTMPVNPVHVLEQEQSRNGKSRAGCGYDKLKDDYLFGLGRFIVQKKATISVGVAIVAIGAYVAYKYGTSSSPSLVEE